MSDYIKMMNGVRPEGCICEVARDASYMGYSGPEPAEWDWNPECLLHGEPA